MTYMGVLGTATRNRAVLCVVWAIATITGLYQAALYSSTPAEVEATAVHWPVETSVPRLAGKAQLVLTLHPKCVCSRATLEELATLQTRAKSPAHVDVLMYEPVSGFDRKTIHDLAEHVQSIPGVHIHRDLDGEQARRFGLLVSGQAAYYSADGRLLFSGGITAGRGHKGDNAGRRTLAALISGANTQSPSTPVFGCSLWEKLTRE